MVGDELAEEGGERFELEEADEKEQVEFVLEVMEMEVAKLIELELELLTLLPVNWIVAGVDEIDAVWPVVDITLFLQPPLPVTGAELAFWLMMRHDESELSFCLLLADRLAPNLLTLFLMVAEEDDGCCC